MNDIIAIALPIILLLIVAFFLPQFLMKRATFKVIKIFQQHDAISIKKAKPLDELGLMPQTMLEKLWKPRDYKSRALQFLISHDIVRTTDDGKLYLDEGSLAPNLRKNY